MKNNPLDEMHGVITRDLVDAGLPERLASPLAEFAAASVCLHYARQQVYYPEAAVATLRNRALRELNRRALATVPELSDLTGLSRRRIYTILQRKVAP